MPLRDMSVTKIVDVTGMSDGVVELIMDAFMPFNYTAFICGDPFHPISTQFNTENVLKECMDALKLVSFSALQLQQ